MVVIAAVLVVGVCLFGVCSLCAGILWLFPCERMVLLAVHGHMRLSCADFDESTVGDAGDIVTKLQESKHDMPHRSIYPTTVSC